MTSETFALAAEAPPQKLRCDERHRRRPDYPVRKRVARRLRDGSAGATALRKDARTLG
jgi:hypothetical protein